jgi:glycosyltransferase involved in cell wall biosynthesis
LSGWISAEAGDKILAEAIREELKPQHQTTSLPLLTIAICTKDRPEGAERLLLSLREQVSTLPEGSAGVEIVVIDNASSDERTRDMMAHHPAIRYVREDRPGLNFARNRALREARGILLAFLDDDVVVDRHWLAGLACAWAENPNAATFTGQVLPLELETEAQCVFERRGGFRREFDRVRYGPVLEGNPLHPTGAGIFGAGANMAFNTNALRHMGGFDEALDTGSFVPGGGDLDIFYRTIRSGYALVYEPRFMVFHQHRREMTSLRAQYSRSWGLGFMCYVSKCLKTDPEERTKLIRLIYWWFANELNGLFKGVAKRVLGRQTLPPSIFLWELWGGCVGLLGGYSRSLRRTEQTRKRFS